MDSDSTPIEADTIGKFILSLYHRHIVSPRNNWIVDKKVLKEMFQNFVTEAENEVPETIDESNVIAIERQLTSSAYVRSHNLTQFRIRKECVFQYRNRLIKHLDDLRKKIVFAERRNEVATVEPPVAEEHSLNHFELDEDVPWLELAFRDGDMQLRNPTFRMTNTACFVCQINFENMDCFEQHAAGHYVHHKPREQRGQPRAWVTPKLKLSYKLCKNLQYVCFSIESLTRGIIIENVVMVYPRMMKYLRDAWYPVTLPMGLKDFFYVDARLLPVAVEHPFIIIFRQRSTSMVEQHVFKRNEAFPPPPVDYSCTPISLPNASIFEPNFAMAIYAPCRKVLAALASEQPIFNLSRASRRFHEYLNNGRVLTYGNMFTTLSILLQLEDVAAMCNYCNLTQCVPKLTKVRGRYTIDLRVPPPVVTDNAIFPFDEVIIIAERAKWIVGHLSLMHTLLMDRNMLHTFNRQDRVIYFGLVVSANSERVTFFSRTKIPKNEPFILMFRSNRRAVRLQYQAIEIFLFTSPHQVMRFHFPEAPSKHELLPEVQLDLFNPIIASDPNQLSAVQVISERVIHCNQAPFIIFGPAGSGKTTIVVEAILQLYLRNPVARILVTAGTNSACNEIALRLLQALAPRNDTRACVRIFARSNEKRHENIDPLIIKHSNIYGRHFYPAIEVLLEYRIVVCTLCVVAALRTGFYGTEAQLTHIFVDEAAASTHSETLVGLAGLISPSTSLILSGDPKQLNQVLQSHTAAAFGLDISLMERLLSNACYSVDSFGNYDRRVQTRLRNNYRSHPEIVNLFSRLYYKGELVPKAPIDVQNLCRNWHRSLNSYYPIIFHSVIGTEERYSYSPSAHNKRELFVIMDYVKELLYFGVNGVPIAESDIGIISPYKEQCNLVKKELNLRSWLEIETGSVEVFQGREKKIIIVSFVRTNAMGFLHNPRRLNVILSRARCLLILVGNPLLLQTNPDFKLIIDECRRHKTLYGAPIGKHFKNLNKN